jgi:hypothetical protein
MPPAEPGYILVLKYEKSANPRYELLTDACKKLWQGHSQDFMLGKEHWG